MATHAPTNTKPLSVRPVWSEERKEMLRRLWKARRTSGEIAKQLGGVSRNAVMGMVNRLGLMGKGGSNVPHPTLGEAKNLLAEVLGVPYDHEEAGHDEVLVAIAGAMCGRDAECIAHCLRMSKGRIDAVLARFHETGVWVAEAPTPDAWFDGRTGNVAMAMDSMVAAGRIRRERRPDGQWTYLPLVGEGVGEP